MSVTAEELIAMNRRSKAKFLDLGNCSLGAIPPSLFENTWIEELSFASEWWEWDVDFEYRERRTSGNSDRLNNIRDIPSGITNLGRLTKLWLGGDLHLSFQLSDVRHLASLANLEVLSLASTSVTTIEPLRPLSKLRVLDMWDADRLVDIKAVEALRELRVLDLWGTAIDDVSPLADLHHLQFLNIASTGVFDLMPLVPMFASDIEVEDEYEPEEDGSGIFVRGCPIVRPPPEIVQGGSEAVLLYLREAQTQGVDHLYEAKMLIVGEGGAGKTSLLKRLYLPGEPLPKEDETTKGIHIQKHEFKTTDGTIFRLNVWDFGGQEIYHATHQFFLTKRSFYVLLDDTRRDSKTIHDEGFKYWLEVIDALSAHSPVLIFQNEKGGRSKVIDEAGIKGRFTNVVGVHAGDLSDPGSVERVRAAIEYQVTQLPHVGEELPAKWVLIRADIEQESQAKHYISTERYFDIYSRHLPLDKAKALHLSRYLHDLGVFLHFQDDDLLRRTVVLQNDWATAAVFRMVDDNTVKANFGRFTKVDCERVWSDVQYADMVPELLTLMQKFELCYRLPDAAADTWLATQLLSPSRPQALHDWEKQEDLVLKFRFEFMPKGIISRLMVRQHRLVQQPELGWVSGVLFEDCGSHLLAVVAPSGSEIVLRSRGAQRKELLSVIAADLDTLNATFHGVKERVQKLIPCTCEVCKSSSTPEFFDQVRLLQRKKDGRDQVECPRSYRSVEVAELLDGLVPKVRAKSRGAARRRKGVSQPREIRIFLASSAELAADRDDFDLHFRQLNDQYRERGVYIKVVRWERLPGSFALPRLQATYNVEVANADVCVCLFSTKAGAGTREELEVAVSSFSSTGRPNVFTFFKDEPVIPRLDMKDNLASLWDLQARLADLGHFWNHYENIDQLTGVFREQLDLWIKRHL